MIKIKMWLHAKCAANSNQCSEPDQRKNDKNSNKIKNLWKEFDFVKITDNNKDRNLLGNVKI
ncbi:hypothetical protein CRG86_015055 [Photobacterium leiognathi]|nr:hypothetical protein CRG86_015055 [Photobacterium leiognathi]